MVVCYMVYHRVSQLGAATLVICSLGAAIVDFWCFNTRRVRSWRRITGWNWWLREGGHTRDVLFPVRLAFEVDAGEEAKVAGLWLKMRAYDWIHRSIPVAKQTGRTSSTCWICS
eukprot:TRINITY_DN11505_c0_g1_i3.p2 TRINITY_DN11505_c0_g1~~TRINITY_DN11505_c0_g1_i3.p2  ORF type:complete len:114 (-),score=7.39 TRINITY_DN11505_c0_g1_i3:322-663(-)